jgi:small subunit ribosomal protein S15
LSITKEKTQELIQEFGQGAANTGATEVQVAILSTRIKALTAHLTANKKDFSTRRGLLAMVGQRRRLLRYLQRTNKASFDAVIQKLGIRA